MPWREWNPSLSLALAVLTYSPICVAQPLALALSCASAGLIAGLRICAPRPNTIACGVQRLKLDCGGAFDR